MKKTLLIITVLMMIAIAPLVSAQIIDVPSLEASLAYQDPDPVEPGDKVELRFSLKNTGTSPAKSTELEIISDYPFTLSPGEKEIQSLGDIKVYDSDKIDTGESAVKFKLVVAEDALEGNYNLVLRYKTEEGISKGEWISFDAFSITVGSKGTHLILEESSTNPEKVGPGQTGILTLSFSNAGNAALEDIAIDIDLTSIPEISPLNTGTELIINKLESGTTKEVTFSLILAPDAMIKVYKIPLNLTYKDARGNDYEKVTYTSIVAGAEPEYILNLEDSDVYKQKQSGNIVISLSNIGVANINYATLTLKENDYYTILSPDAVYLGNLESDDFETAQFTIYSNDYAEEVPLEFTLFYKDNYNNNYEEEIILQMKLFTSGEAKRYGLSEGSNSWLFFLVIVAAGGGYYWWKYKRKKKVK